MRIFTEKGFQEELSRRQEAFDEKEYIRRRFKELEERIERLYTMVEELRIGVIKRKEE